MLELSRTTLKAIADSMTAINAPEHESTAFRLASIIKRAEALPFNKQQTLMIRTTREEKTDGGVSTVTCLAMGSYQLLHCSTEQPERVVLLKRIGGQARAFFDSHQEGLTDKRLVSKAYSWMDKTLCTLEKR